MSNDDTWLAELAGAVLSRESAALAALVGAVESSVVTVARRMLDVPGKVVTTGSGTSGIMAERLAHLLSVCGTPAVYLPSMDALHGGMGAITTSDLVVAISKTGQSRELISLVERLAQRGVDVVAVTESPDSPFAVAAAQCGRTPTDTRRRRSRRHDRDGQHLGGRRVERRRRRADDGDARTHRRQTSSTAIRQVASASAVTAPATSRHPWYAHDERRDGGGLVDAVVQGRDPRPHQRATPRDRLGAAPPGVPAVQRAASAGLGECLPHGGEPRDRTL